MIRQTPLIAPVITAQNVPQTTVEAEKVTSNIKITKRYEFKEIKNSNDEKKSFFKCF